MNWQNCDNFFEEEKIQNPELSEYAVSDTQIKQQNELKNAIQLEKYRRPSQNQERQKYITFLEEFRVLIDSQNYAQIFNSLFTEDCDIFLINLHGKEKLVQYYSVRENLTTLYPEIKIIRRQVRETYVDVLKRTAIQLSTCHIYYDESQTEGDEILIELFSFREDKVSKYRVSFGSLTSAHGPGDPLEPTHKDKVIAKVKEINYALADQPDLEKVAALFDETTEYKIWSWDGQKRFDFDQNNFTSRFHELEENYKIKCIVPYEIYTEREYIIGTYVYRLENKTTSPGKPFMWLATSVYTFDKNAKLTRVIQHGELYSENEIEIPFKVHTREKLEQKFEKLIENVKTNSEFLSSDGFQLDCDILRLGPFESPNLGRFQGLTQVLNLSDIFSGGFVDFEWLKIADLYIDLDSPCYDVGIAITVAEGMLHSPDTPYSGIRMDFFSIARIAFENGKPAKTCQFYTMIAEPTPSPFDGDFEAINIIKKA